jgi:hypothetical protein
MTITLPLPSVKLSPNGSRGRSKNALIGRSKIVRQHREHAKLRTLEALKGKPSPGFTRYTLTFYFKESRRRDDDNFSARCKAYRDGIAQGLKVDDHTLRMAASPEMLIDATNPRLEITLIP